MCCAMQIEHNPNERRETNTIWWLIWPMLALQWIGYLYFREFDLWAIAIGAFSGIVFIIWAMEITGNKVPDSWRRQPPRR